MSASPIRAIEQGLLSHFSTYHDTWGSVYDNLAQVILRLAWQETQQIVCVSHRRHQTIKAQIWEVNKVKCGQPLMGSE